MDGINSRETYTIVVLFYVNILNYMDRFTVAGVLTLLQDDLDMQDDYAGLLQTAFTISYATTAPIFGYLGDHYSRRRIMILSVLLWSGATLVGSFTSTYSWFLVTRMLVGVGQASFSTIGPTVVYDATCVKMRKNALTLFYMALPLGGGLGFAVGAAGAHVGGSWNWGLRLTPCVAAIGLLLLYFTEDPVRGVHERRESRDEEVTLKSRSATYIEDLKMIWRTKSFVLTTAGFMCAAFVSGALSWWAPTFLHSGFRLIPGHEDIDPTWISINVGVIAIVTGIIGVPLGTYLSQIYSPYYAAVDPLICAIGLFLAAPIVTVGVLYADTSMTVTFISITIGQLCMNITWALIADIVLSVIIPEVRSTAEAAQIFFGHMIGDAEGPYFIGVVSEYLKNRWNEQDSNEKNPEKRKLVNQFKAMKHAILTLVCVQILGATMFALCVFHIVEDREAMYQMVIKNKGRGSEFSPSSSSSGATSTSTSTTLRTSEEESK